MNKPIISVIIPCYNSGRYLSDTLQSVIKQTYKDWECILVDDGSLDNTEEIAQRYSKDDARFRYIKKTNEGVSATRNTGLNAAYGDYIQFLDSDDVFGKKKLQASIQYLQQNPDVSIAYTGSRYFYTDAPDKLLIYGRNNFMGTMEITRYDQDVLRSVLIRNPFVTSAALYRRVVFEKVGMYDVSLRYLEDWDFQIRCALENMKFHYIGYHPETAIFVRLHDSSLTTNRQKVLDAKKELFEKYKDLRIEYGIERMNTAQFGRLSFRSFIPPLLYSALKKFLTLNK